VPDRIVADDRQQRQIVRLRNKMAGGGIIEHISSIADGDDQSFLRARELHARTAADAPTEAAGGRTAVVTSRLADVEHFVAYAMIADHYGVFVTHLIDAVGQPRVTDGPLAAAMLG
jgi:hypothetical protein